MAESSDGTAADHSTRFLGTVDEVRQLGLCLGPHTSLSGEMKASAETLSTFEEDMFRQCQQMGELKLICRAQRTGKWIFLISFLFPLLWPVGSIRCGNPRHMEDTEKISSQIPPGYRHLG